MLKKNKLVWVLIFVVGLIAVLILPSSILAQNGKTDLTMYITGNYPNNLTPGQDNQLFLSIRNNGTSAVTNIRFSVSQRPEGWMVTFNPATLDSLDPGSSNTIQVDVIPPGSIEKGNYNLTLVAEANETRAVAEAFFNIQGGISYWAWIGIGLAVLLVIGFVIIFLRSGK